MIIGNSLVATFLCLLSIFVITQSEINRPESTTFQRRLRDNDYTVFSLYSTPDETKPASKSGKAGSVEKEQLYEAYNLLHTLAQDFHKPFDAPAVIVVGHQTSGKSALIEALMGFQFNQVGGGTKTRRPVALRMQYNPNCVTPLCFLTMENGKEEQKSLSDIQNYIESENKRLEKDPSRSFDPREINIRMEYRYCPNMIVIDTPGMIHPPKGRSLTPQQRALAQAAREAEALVLSKIRCQDYIILCVEDTTDWKHATTRNVVMQADPQLTRTVLVTTKLDTKIPQFSEPEDLEDFLRAPLIQALFSQMLGGPFYTSVPSGRVGRSGDFDTNDAFVESLRRAERADRSGIMSKLGPVKARATLPQVGVSRLRAFLEARVEDSYRRNVAKIVPMRQSELRVTEAKLAATEEELKSLSLERLKQSANLYREKFSKELAHLIQGTVRASPEEWGEQLEAEQMKGGSFIHQDQVQTDNWRRILENDVGSVNHKLFGGAQYHRAIREFTVAVRHMPSPGITEDEIANAAGMGDTHNGVNFMRAACVIAMAKAQSSFEPMLESLRNRADHIMKRLFPIVQHLVRQSSGPSAADVHSRPFQEMIHRIFDSFVDIQLDDCVQKCRDDLEGMTNYITWDIEDKSGSSTLYRLLPTPQRMVEIYNINVESKQKQQKAVPSIDAEVDSSDEVLDEEDEEEEEEPKRAKSPRKSKDPADKVLDEWSKANGSKKTSEKTKIVKAKDSEKSKAKRAEAQAKISALPQETAMTPVTTTVKRVEDDAELSDYYRVMQLTEEMLSGSSASRTSALVTALVQYIVSSWRNHFARATAMKFNCFFLQSFLSKFPAYLREELDRMYDSGVGEMFDISESRRALLARKSELLAECDANSKLQRRFDQIAAQIRTAFKTDGKPAQGEAEDATIEDDSDRNFEDSNSFGSSFSELDPLASAIESNNNLFRRRPSDMTGFSNSASSGDSR